MFSIRPGRIRGLSVALIFLAAAMSFGCDLRPGDLNGNQPGEESKADNGSGETAESGAKDGLFPDNRSYPKYFKDPVIRLLEMEKRSVLSTYGSPEDTGYYGGGYYLSYQQKAGVIFFFPPTYDDDSLVSSVWITRGEVMGVQIGHTFEEIISVWGEPDGIEYDELESQVWGLSYTFPIKENDVSASLIWVVFFAESEESPTTYVSIKRELH